MNKFNIVKKCRYGFTIYNRRDMYIGRSFDHYGEFSELEVDAIRFFVKEGMHVLDVGANIGAITLPMAQIIGDTGKIYAFEPQRVIFQTLAGNMALNNITNAYCIQKAISKDISETEMFEPNYSYECNFGAIAINTKGPKINTITLDSLIEMERCDFIKADIEGMEKNMLLGGFNFINKFRPVMYLEDNMNNPDNDPLEVLKELNYNVIRHHPKLYNPDNYLKNKENIFDNIGSLNIICTPKENTEANLLVKNIKYTLSI